MAKKKDLLSGTPSDGQNPPTHVNLSDKSYEQVIANNKTPENTDTVRRSCRSKWCKNNGIH